MRSRSARGSIRARVLGLAILAGIHSPAQVAAGRALAVALPRADPALEPELLARYLGAPPWLQVGEGRVRAYAAQGWRTEAETAVAAAERDLPRIAAALGVQPEVVLPVWILISPGGGEFALEAPTWSAAIARPGRHLVVISGPVVHGGGASLQETVGHEIAHLVVHTRIGELGWMPLWLHEGLAVQLSDTRRIRDRLLTWGRGPVQLDELESVFPPDADGARLAYLESQAAVRHLLRLRPLALLLDRVAAGEEFADAFLAVYGMTPATFAAQVYAEVAQRWRYLSVLASSGALFGLMTALFLVASVRRLRRDRRRRREWEAEESRRENMGTDAAQDAVAPPADPGSADRDV